YIDQFGVAIMPPLVFTFFICLFVAIQPDFGTAFIIGLIALSILICSGMGIKSIGKLCLLGIVVAAILSPFVILNADEIFSEERMGRIEGYLDPFGDQGDDGLQLVNSYIALGAGGLTGLGLGQSV